MSQSVLEKAVCEECGVDIRENTSYCYNCGTRIPEAKLSVDAVQEAESEVRDTGSDSVEKPLGLRGDPSVGKINVKGREALDDLAERMKIEDKPADGDAITRAAAQRKLSRSAKRKANEYVWEPVNDRPGGLMLIFVGFIVFLSILAVVMTVIWK